MEKTVQLLTQVVSSRYQPSLNDLLAMPADKLAVVFKREASDLLGRLAGTFDTDIARETIGTYVTDMLCTGMGEGGYNFENRTWARDAGRAMKSAIRPYADEECSFSLTEALMDTANDVRRPDLKPGFYLELLHMVLALEGRPPVRLTQDFRSDDDMSGRKAALVRSAQLDNLYVYADQRMRRYPHGLADSIIEHRQKRKTKLLEILGGNEADWNDWHWQVRHVIKDVETLKRCLNLDPAQFDAIERARKNKLPFGVTPHYMALIDNESRDGRDRALRAQVFPPEDYVDEMTDLRDEANDACDFMGEHDTSPVDLITRRYVSICILKPYNSCPQICVYCQRNWEIDDAMAAGAMAESETLERALDWIDQHPAIYEVLLTGGDPMTMGDGRLERILSRLCKNPNIERIRIGTRTLVTVPQRFTEATVEMLAGFRKPGFRTIEVVTHIQHPYEINPDMLDAVERLRKAGIPVYNQLVYTFFTSRRFEASALRRLIKRMGIDPYYTFNTKGKEETASYRVPLARLMQEQKEEARLLPGLVRTDEPVYNVPRLGKNHLRASQHRDLLSIKPDGSRVYEFHPWEKNIVRQSAYTSEDISIAGYLKRLQAIGEDVEDYETIWYYF